MNLEHAATDLTRAQSELEGVTSVAEKTGDALGVLQARLTAKQEDLATIQQRRLSGDDAESDAALAQLLALDISGLEPLVGNAHAQYQAAIEAQQQAQNTVGQAQQVFERAQAGDAARLLEARLHELENLLLTGIAQLHVLKKAATGSIHIHGQTVFSFSPRLTRFIQTGVLA